MIVTTGRYVGKEHEKRVNQMKDLDVHRVLVGSQEVVLLNS